MTTRKSPGNAKAGKSRNIFDVSMAASLRWLVVALVTTASFAFAKASGRQNGDARLSSYPKGRIEIYNKDGKWGTLCGHHWYVTSSCFNHDLSRVVCCYRWDNQKGASNICKQVGYPEGGTKYNAPGGTGAIVAECTLRGQ